MLKLNLLIGWLVLVLLAGIGGYVLVSHAVVGTANTTAEQDVERSLEMATMAIRLEGRERLEKLASKATSSPLVKLMIGVDSQSKKALDALQVRVRPLMEPIEKELTHDFFWLVDARGRVVTRLEEADLYGDGVAGLPIVEGVLNGFSGAGLMHVNGDVVQMAAVSLVDRGRGIVVGGLVSGRRLNGKWLSELSRQVHTSIAVFFKDNIKAGLDPALSPIVESLIAGLPLQKNWQQGQTSPFRFRGDSGAYYGRAALFGGALGAYRAGVVAVSPLDSGGLALDDERVVILAAGVLALAGLGLLVSLVLAWWIRRRVEFLAQAVSGMSGEGVIISGLDEKKCLSEFRVLARAINSLKPVANSSPTKSPATEALRELNGNDAESLNKLFDDADRARGEVRSGAGEKTEDLSDKIVQMVTQPREKPPAVKGDPARTIVATAPALNAGPIQLEPELDETAPPPSLGREIGEDTNHTQPVTQPDTSEPQNETAHFEQTWGDFIALRKELGQPTDTVNRDKFIANLAGSARRIRAKHECAHVRFTVFDKDGKATIKGAPA